MEMIITTVKDMGRLLHAGPVSKGFGADHLTTTL